ncbi:coiled-coil domain-containing protein 32 isoform X2 [Mixophyes fleayi]|uniref:coiled-coil domain-containing protein 32 isoform X2 n=1 Tax=Mixophyes fleayi TaxID=3061075 RepID=UPI003F4DF977
MRMIESIDSGTTVSSQDMWADICPCAPDIQEMNLSETFSDSFLCPSNGINQDLSTCEAEHDPLCCTQKPWSPLQDSEVYLASLGQAKKECWDRFLQETFEPEAYVGTSEVDSSTLEHLKRWLQPEKVAISAEEVQCLIPGESPPVNAENEQDSATGEH